MLHIGLATRDITPTRPAIIPGQMHIRIGRAARDPLTLTAMALDSGTPDGRAMIISCDQCYVTRELNDEVAARLGRRIPELAGRPVFLNPTHTHASFMIEEVGYPDPGVGVMSASEGREWLVAHAVEAAFEAWEQRRVRQIGRAFAHAVVGCNRRAVYASGLARMYGSTADPQFRHVEGGADHTLDLIFIWDEDGTLAGIVIDLPCPAQVDSAIHDFSADFWHEIREELRRRLGAHLLIVPLCGAAGDQSPDLLLHSRLEAEMRTRTGRSVRQDIAMRVADAVTSALAWTKPMCGPVPVACISVPTRLSPRFVTLQERDWAVARREEAYQRGDTPGDLWPQRLKPVIEAYDHNRPLTEVHPTLYILRLGDAVIATCPFELYLDLGLQIKERSPAAQTLLVNLAGGCDGYLPTERSILAGDYGSHPVSSAVGVKGGQDLVEATLAAIASLFPEGRG